MCSQPIVQAAHDDRATRRPALRLSPEIASTSAKVPAWKLRVGSALRRLKVNRFDTVPSSRYLAVAGPNDLRDSSFAAVTTRSGSATSVRCDPRTSTAFRFFEPSTAPWPPRPAWRLSWLTVANFTSRSPAGPITAG